MKKINQVTKMWFVAVLISLFSFTYLQVVSSEVPKTQTYQTLLEQVPDLDNEKQLDSDLIKFVSSLLVEFLRMRF